VIDWIKKHQVSAFFLITFAIMGSLGFSISSLVGEGSEFLFPLAAIAACGPGIAGIAISRIINSNQNIKPKTSFWKAFFIFWLGSLVVFMSNLKFNEDVPISVSVVIIIALSVWPVAIIFAHAYSRISSHSFYPSSLVRFQGLWRWSAIALLVFPGIVLVILAFRNVFGIQFISFPQFPEVSTGLLGLIIVKLVYQYFFFNATGEETGWRGFAMPRLQSRTSPLVTAIIIGVFWTIWHYFIWEAEGRSVGTSKFWAEMFIAHIMLSVIITWLCNKANGSILVAGLAHAALNTFQAFSLLGNIMLISIIVAGISIIIVSRMWRKLLPDHPAVYNYWGQVSSP
jgi:membrane protease YdiL (CAAX protease family)